MKVDETQPLDALLFGAKALNLQVPFGTTWLASRHDSGKLAGVVFFCPPANGNCLMHMAAASPFWFSPEFCRAVFRHAFQTLAVQRVTATTYQSNIPSVRLLRRTGWELEGTSRGFTGGTMLLFGMLKENCKWVES